MADRRQHLTHALGRGRRALTLGDDHAQHPQGPDQQVDVRVELHQLTERQRTREHLLTAVRQHEDEADVRQELHRGQVAGAHAGGLHGDVVHVVGLGPEASGLDPLRPEPLDHANPADRLLDDRGQLGGLALDAHDHRVQPRAEPLAEVVEEREGIRATAARGASR
jgi:hypothetical protein